MHFTSIREYDLPPLDEQGTRDLLEAWIEQRRGTAKITGKKAVNLNPLITADGGGGRQVDLAWWWIHVGGAPAKFSAFNARDDKLLSSQVWKGPFREHRALAPATWYDEKGRRFAVSSHAHGHQSRLASGLSGACDQISRRARRYSSRLPHIGGSSRGAVFRCRHTVDFGTRRCSAISRTVAPASLMSTTAIRSVSDSRSVATSARARAFP